MRYLLFITALFFSPLVFAGLSLSQAIVHFEEGGKRSEDVDVFNQGQETLYVRIEPSIIHHPGTPQEQREIYRDPKAAGLLVTPQRMVLAPGSRKRLRFVRLDDANLAAQDSIYRILVKPEVGEVKSNQTAVKIIVAYEVLVLSQPAKTSGKLESDFTDNQLTLRNVGNSNVLLQKGFQCPLGESIDDEDNQCVELAGKRIYAGNSWQIDVPYKTPVKYQISIGLENSEITFERVQKSKK